MAAAAPRDPQPDDPAEPEGGEPGVEGSGPDPDEWQPRPNDFLVEPMFAPFGGGPDGAGEAAAQPAAQPTARPTANSGARPEQPPVPGSDGPGGPTGPADGRRSPWAWIRRVLGLD